MCSACSFLVVRVQELGYTPFTAFVAWKILSQFQQSVSLLTASSCCPHVVAWIVESGGGVAGGLSGQILSGFLVKLRLGREKI
jgi:hypothetical protein